MTSTHEAELDLPMLPPAARHIHIVPDLASSTLLSMGQFCDAGCTVTFTAAIVEIYHNDTLILVGHRSPATTLWHLSLPTNPIPPAVSSHTALATVGSATPAALVAFAHAALFSPVLSTLQLALQKGYITNFPGLTATLLRKHPPHSIAMIKGHMDQSRQNQRSTRTDTQPDTAPTPDATPSSPSDDDIAPTSPTPNHRSHLCYAAVFEPTGQVFTDQTGRFVTPSSTGNNYLLLLYDFDSNAIIAEPIKNRTGPSILAGYTRLHATLLNAGLHPRLQRLDNECSEPLKQFLRDQDIDFQLAPPGIHRRNAAERAIRTFKNHFIAGLCSVDKHFPLHLWDRLVPQAVLTLNLLRGSRLNPKLSAWAQLYGHYDFNRTPIAPPGIRVLVHDKPANRSTWSPHASDGWYVGPALDSYRCYTIWMFDTRAERITDTLSWFPTKVNMPLASSNDLILAGLHDIAHALCHPSPNSPLAPLTDSHVAALHQLTTLLTGLATPGPPGLPPPAAAPAAPALRVQPTPVPTPVPPFDPPAPPVPNTAAPPVPNPAAPVLRVAEPNPIPAAAPALTVDEPVPAPTRTVTVADLPVAIDPDATYENSTGAVGRRRRRQQRKQHRKPTVPAPTPPRHKHGTRANAPHLTATATTVPHTDVASLPDLCDHVAYHGNAFNPDTGQLAEYTELTKCSEGELWIQACRDEFGRLCHGHGTNMPTGTNTMFFIPVNAIPKDKKPTYLKIVAAFRPEKANPRRVRFTVGGDRITYDGDVSTKTADLSTVKTLLNSVISTPGARFMTGDLKDFYLNTPMAEYEYMRIPVSVIPESIMLEYNLAELVHNNHVYVEIRKGMYGLPQAGRIANDRLTAFLAPHGYAPAPITPGLWKHAASDLVFVLVVDDFGVKYTDKADAERLMQTLKELYAVSEDWSGARYCGLTIDWDYPNHTVDISIPGYIERSLQRFQHPPPTRPQHSPHAWQKPTYGAKTQFAPEPDTAPALDAKDTKHVQEVLGTLLFYARAVDSTMLTAIGTLASQQAHGTTATLTALTQLLNYCASHPNATVRFHASDMVLHVDSDASYLTAPKARSRAAGYHFLSSRPRDPTLPPSPTDPLPPTNGAIHVLCQIMRDVVSSAAEAELAALFHNGKEACPLRVCLEELGHPQPPTPIQSDNSTATGIANDTVKQKCSKAIDMRFYWIRDRVRQGQFHVYWKRGILNKADYFTKHHPAKHHQQIRSSYLYSSDDRSANYFDCLQEESPSDSGEGVLKSKSPGGPSNSTPIDHNPNGYKTVHAESPIGEPTALTITHKFT